MIDLSNEEQSIKNSNLFHLDKKNNLFEINNKINVNLTTDSDKTQIISEIEETKRYYSESGNLVTLRFADIDRKTSIEEEEEEWNKTAEEIFDKYYSEYISEKSDEDKNEAIFNEEQKKSPTSEEYPHIVENHDELQDIEIYDIKNFDITPQIPNKLFYEEEKNKIIYSCYYCEFKADARFDYEKHVVLTHSKGLAYPDLASIAKDGLKPQGKPWEEGM